MRRTRPLALHVEQLEARDVPVTWGNPWPDATHLTISFAPDGTNVAGKTSTLFNSLNSHSAQSTWTQEILRAFQTWAVNANINIGLVADGGQEIGATGRLQGDSRFGDIRISAVPMSGEVMAITSPFEPTGGTWSGDIRLNSNYSFGVNGSGDIDLYTAILQEAGHAFGLDNSNDPTSVMYEYYQGARTGLSAGDVANLQALYGSRAPDQLEGASGNNTLSTATSLSLLGGPIDADISTRQDLDYYRFTAPLGVTGVNISVRTSGVSLLNSRLTVYDASGRVVGSAVASDPLHGDLSINLTSLKLLSTYYVKVEGASKDAFGIGSYQLSVQTLPLTGTVNSLLNATNQVVTGLLNDDLHTNDSFLTASLLSPLTFQTDSRFDYGFKGSIRDNWDVDYYRIQAPKSGAASVMTVMVWGTENNGLAPRVTVYNAQKQAGASELLLNEEGNYIVQVLNPTAGATYYVKVEAANPSGANNTGNYFLGIDFGTQPVVMQTLTQASLNATQPERTSQLTLKTTQLFHYVLSAEGPAGATVQMTITNASGVVVGTLTAKVGQPVSLTLTMPAGVYKFRFSSSAGVTYTLRGIRLSDPIGPESEDPTADPATTSRTTSSPSSNPPPPSSTTSSTTTSGGSTTYTAPPPSSTQPQPTTSTRSSSTSSPTPDQEAYWWTWQDDSSSSNVASSDPYGNPYQAR